MLHLQFYVSSGAAQEAGATGYNLRAQLRSEARMFEHGGYTPWPQPPALLQLYTGAFELE